MNIPFKHELLNGTIEWRLPNGLLHREDSPAVMHPNGHQRWYQYGLLHREDGPAIMRFTGSKYWYQYDKLHRADGPAVIRSNGRVEYWLNGKQYNPVTFLIKRYEYTIQT